MVTGPGRSLGISESMSPSTAQIDEAIDSITELERRAQANLSPHQRWIERVTRRVGRPRTLYAFVVFVALWTTTNLALAAAHHAPFDPPPFALLDGLMSFFQVLMVILILTTENRIAQLDLLRERLDLQINLLNERRTAKLIEMVDALRRDLPSVPTLSDPEVRVLAEHTDPHQVADAIEARTPEEPGAP